MPYSEAPLEQKLSVPAYGRTVWSTVTRWTEPLFSVYKTMIISPNSEEQDRIAVAYDNIFSPIIPSEVEPTQEQKTKLAASAMLSIWMISQCANKTEQTKTLSDAEEWFLGRHHSPQLLRISQICKKWSSEDICETLSSLAYDGNFQDLFPYIVEIFETLSVFKPRSHVPIKKRFGLYYTPSDVCDFIVQETLKPWQAENALGYPSVGPTCIDPACGSGVFLRAILNWQKTKNKLSKLDVIPEIYGMDIGHQAIQSCVFTLLLDCIEEVLSKGLVSWRVWQAIRINFAVKDSTSIAGYQRNSTPKSDGCRRKETREMLLDINTDKFERLPATEVMHHELPSLVGMQTLCDVFPEISDGFSVLVGNPPYLSTTYLQFVRMMWNFTNKRYARAGMVLPLSLAYHSGKDFCSLRRTILAKGSWHFSFFDRTPDSLFGDDIKTRNCIAIADFSGNRKSIATTNLRRWNSQNRECLFSNIMFTELNGLSIERLIPKIGSEQELMIYKLLMDRKKRLGSLVKTFSSYDKNHNDSRIFFRSTAYNWIPVFRHLPIIPNIGWSVSSTFNYLDFSTPLEADFGFAVASSHISYWLWRVQGDGFHLTRNFLTRLPFHPIAFSELSIKKLCHLSHELWEKLQVNPIKKFNAGVLTMSYSPYDCASIIERIDKLIIEAYNLPKDFLFALQRIVTDTIEAGRVNPLQLCPVMEETSTEGD